MHGAGQVLARNFEAGNLIAKVEREVKCCFALGDGSSIERRRRQNFTARRHGGNLPAARARLGRQHLGADGACRAANPGDCQRARTRHVAIDVDGPAGGERGQRVAKCRGPCILDAVREPRYPDLAALRAKLLGDLLGGGGPVSLKRFRRQRREALPEILRRQRRKRLCWLRGGEEIKALPAFLDGRGQLLGEGLPLGPAARRRPAIVHHHDERLRDSRRRRRLRLEDRPCQSGDDARRDQHP